MTVDLPLSAKDFCRGLYNLLQAEGISCFLDFEFREELSDLEKIVGRCDNFIFVLSDNVFDSPWCIKELEAAVKAKKNIILVTKDGSRWKDANGSKTCSFPPFEITSSLSAEAQKAFVSKAVEHSDEYYEAFKEQLIKRIKRSTFIKSENSAFLSASLGGNRRNSQANLATTARAMSSSLDNNNVFDDIVLASERALSSKIFSSERSLIKQIDSLSDQMHEEISGSEQILAKKLSAQSQDFSDQVQALAKKLNAHSRDFSDQVQDVEKRLNSKLEERMREIRDAIVGLSGASSGTYGRSSISPQSLSPGAQMAMTRSLEDHSEVQPSQMLAYAAADISPMASRPGTSRVPSSARPQSSQRSQGSDRGIGSGILIKGNLIKSPKTRK